VFELKKANKGQWDKRTQLGKVKVNTPLAVFLAELGTLNSLGLHTSVDSPIASLESPIPVRSSSCLLGRREKRNLHIIRKSLTQCCRHFHRDALFAVELPRCRRISPQLLSKQLIALQEPVDDPKR
jgi:hypothetical protein